MTAFVPPTLPLKLCVFYQTYKEPRATFESLRNFRRHFPDTPIRMISDNGDDESKIAAHFGCEYIQAKDDATAHVPPCAFPDTGHLLLQLRRLVDTARFFEARAEWMLILEDDVLTRGPIKHPPTAPISGPCTMDYTPALQQYIRQKHPHLCWVFGYSGAGGTVLHIPSLLMAIDKPEAELLKAVAVGGFLDDRIPRFGDALLTYLFLDAGFSNGPPWLDESETSQGRGRPDAAFDHQWKVFYGRPWDDKLLTKDTR